MILGLARIHAQPKVFHEQINFSWSMALKKCDRWYAEDSLRVEACRTLRLLERHFTTLLVCNDPYYLYSTNQAGTERYIADRSCSFSWRAFVFPCGPLGLAHKSTL